MLSNFRHLKRCIIILTIIGFSLGIGEKATLCFTPDGDVHVEQSHSLCQLTGECPDTAGRFDLSNDRVENQNHCRDVALGRNAFNHHQRNIVPNPSLALVPLIQPIILALTDQKPFYTTPAVTPPQLVSLQSVILLI